MLQEMGTQNDNLIPLPKVPLISLPIDAVEAFDYENAEKAMYTVADLKNMLYDEIKHFRFKNDKPAGVSTSKTENESINMLSTGISPDSVFRGQ